MTKIFRDYDAAALEAQFKLRMHIPDVDDYYTRWNGISEAMRASRPCRIDVAYGEKPGEKLDIFPAANPGAPVHVFIHGGYWQLLDKVSHSFLGEPSLNAGHAYVPINYTLAPGATMDEIVAENRRAIAWVYRNATSFNADPNRIYVSGHSAGGHLVAMLLATDWGAFGSDLPADIIKGGCSISGLFDLEPIRLCYLNEKLRMDEAESRRNSPIGVLPRGRTPLVVSVGGDETHEYIRQSAEYHEALVKRDYPSSHLLIDGTNHFSVVETLSDPGSALTKAFFGLIDGKR